MIGSCTVPLVYRNPVLSLGIPNDIATAWYWPVPEFLWGRELFVGKIQDRHQRSADTKTCLEELRLLVKLGKELSELSLPAPEASENLTTLWHWVQMDFLLETCEGLGFTIRLTWGPTEATHMYEEQKQKRILRAKAVRNFKKSSRV